MVWLLNNDTEQSRLVQSWDEIADKTLENKKLDQESIPK